MKSILFAANFFVAVFLANAQKTEFWRNPLGKINDAKLAFTTSQYEVACPLFKDLQQSIEQSPLEFTPLQKQEINFYAIACRLFHAESQAEKEALQFIATIPAATLRDRMHYWLGEYYFARGQWSEALDQYSLAGIANLSNAEIASMQFRQGYSYFVLQRYKEATPYLNSVRSLTGNSNQLPATYYYGLLAFKEKKWEEALRCLQQAEPDPRYAGLVPYYIAQLKLLKGEPEEVIIYLEKKLSDPVVAQMHAPEMRQLLGHTYFTTQNYGKAYPLLKEVVAAREQPSRQDIYEFSYSAYQQGSLETAVEGFKKLSEGRDSLGQHAMYLLGDAYLRLGDKQGARNAFLFCALNTSNPDLQENARFFHAKLSYEAGYFDQALRGFQQFLREYPLSVYKKEATELLVAVLAATSNYREALVLVDSMTAPNRKIAQLLPLILYGRAAELIHDKKITEADKLLDRGLVDLNNISVLPFLHFWKGELSFQKEDYETAVEHMRSYIELGAPVAGEATPQNARYNLGYSHLRLAQYAQAATYFEWLTVRSGNNSSSTLYQDAVLRLADCQMMLRNYSTAKNNYEKVIKLGSVAADYATYQLALLAGIRNSNEKIKLLIGLTEKYSNSGLKEEAWMGIADTYMADEKHREALPYLERIVQSTGFSSRLPEAYFKTGLAYYNSDENEKALKQFQIIMDKFPHSPEAADALENIRALYVESGRSVEFISYMKKQGLSLSISSEDSLTYIAAEQQHAAKQWNQAATSLTEYLNNFPKGDYVLDASFLLAEIKTQTKDWVGAVPLYEKVLSMAPNRYAEASALQAARIYFFEVRDFSKAGASYKQLLSLSSRPENRLEALRGSLRSFYQLKQWSQAAETAELLLLEKNTSSDDRTLAAMSKARLYLGNGKETEALAQFKMVVLQNKAELAAEARYEMAAILFRQQQWNAAEKAAFETINKSGSYEEWVTRSYLLLGDIYGAQKDYFNARATYRSVLENATNEEWKKEAQNKLEELTKTETDAGKKQ
jgi:TolA-binding protein